jgi:hypothetical protein
MSGLVRCLRAFARKLCAVAWLPLFAIAMPALAQAPKIKVLIVEGFTNHDWKHRVEIVRAILAKEGSFDVDVTVAPASASDPAMATWRPNFAA